MLTIGDDGVVVLHTGGAQVEVADGKVTDHGAVGRARWSRRRSPSRPMPSTSAGARRSPRCWGTSSRTPSTTTRTRLRSARPAPPSRHFCLSALSRLGEGAVVSRCGALDSGRSVHRPSDKNRLASRPPSALMNSAKAQGWTPERSAQPSWRRRRSRRYVSDADVVDVEVKVGDTEYDQGDEGGLE